MLLLKTLAYTIAIPCTIAAYVPWLFVAHQSASTGIWLFLSTVLFFLGGAVYSWCIWDFATFGHGTPAPLDSPKHLVVQGLYHYMRNPMYGGVLTLLFGWIALFPSLRLLLYSLSVGLCMHLFVLLYEEPQLQKVFGTSYDEYRMQVGRWVPLISRER